MQPLGAWKDENTGASFALEQLRPDDGGSPDGSNLLFRVFLEGVASPVVSAHLRKIEGQLYSRPPENFRHELRNSELMDRFRDYQEGKLTLLGAERIKFDKFSDKFTLEIAIKEYFLNLIMVSHVINVIPKDIMFDSKNRGYLFSFEEKFDLGEIFELAATVDFDFLDDVD